MISFTPALCQVTTISLPTTLSAGKDCHFVRFKATFSSLAECAQAKRDGVRVEMWTNLTTVGGPAGGVWRALAFDYASDAAANAEVESADNVFSFVSSEEEDRAQAQECAVFLDVHVPGDIFSYWDHPRYSFTYRLVYRSGHVEWLGSFGYDGVLAFEAKDSRVTFGEASQVSTTGGGYIVESERLRPVGVGKLSSTLVWERWSFGGNGPSFSRSHITSPSGCVILTPSPVPGVHCFTPEALQPMILTAGQDGSSLSISESGDITFHPGVEAPYDPAGFTAAGARMLAVGKDSTVLDYDATSDAVVVTSSVEAAPGESHTSPISLSIVPLGPRPRGATHLDVKISSQKLAGVFPGADLVLYPKVQTQAHKFKVFSASECKEDFITIRVKPSGDQILVAPLHDLSVLFQTGGEEEVAKPVDMWQVAVVSPHVSARVTNEIHDASSAFPTPPPSPPLRSYVLGNPLNSAPSIDAVLASIPEEEHAEDARSGTVTPSTRTVSPSSATSAPRGIKELLLSPSPSSVFEVPKYVASQVFEAYPAKYNAKKSITSSPLTAVHALLHMNLVSLIYALLGPVFGILSLFFSMVGIKLHLPEATSNTEIEVYEELEDDAVEERTVKADTSIDRTAGESDEASDHEEDVMSEGTFIDTEDDRTPLSSPHFNFHDRNDSKAKMAAEALLRTPPSPAPAVAATPVPALRVSLPKGASAVSLLLRPPPSVPVLEKSTTLADKINLSIDGKPSSEFSWTVIQGDIPTTFITELRGDGPLGQELKVSVSA